MKNLKSRIRKLESIAKREEETVDGLFVVPYDVDPKGGDMELIDVPDEIVRKYPCLSTGMCEGLLRVDRSKKIPTMYETQKAKHRL